LEQAGLREIDYQQHSQKMQETITHQREQLDNLRRANENLENNRILTTYQTQESLRDMESLRKYLFDKEEMYMTLQRTIGNLLSAAAAAAAIVEKSNNKT